MVIVAKQNRLKKETTSGKRDVQASLYEVYQKAIEMIDYGGDV